jgi:hypothetical protein
MNCVHVARSFDLNATLKAMFRVRGETNRIDVADGLARAAYAGRIRLYDRRDTSLPEDQE